MCLNGSIFLLSFYYFGADFVCSPKSKVAPYVDGDNFLFFFLKNESFTQLCQFVSWLHFDEILFFLKKFQMLALKKKKKILLSGGSIIRFFSSSLCHFFSAASFLLFC